MLVGEKSIKKAINSRSNLSAHGPDSFSNTIWKLGGVKSVTIIQTTIQLMLKCGKCPQTKKRGKSIMVYKKCNPKSWRPITITPSIYRILMCHISSAFQKLNETSPFIHRAQNGFMKNPNGAGEHCTIINELIHDATREKNNIYLRTIDLGDAFGKIPHKLISDSLFKKGFDLNMINMVGNIILKALIAKHPHAKFYEDSAMRTPEGDIIPELNNLRPDIIMVDVEKRETKVIEITVPYGTLSNGENTLETRRKGKINIYKKISEYYREHSE